MSPISFSLIILWSLLISATIISFLYIDSSDCTKFTNGWDKVCNNKKEHHKQGLMQTMLSCGMVFSIILVIIFRESPKPALEMDDKK